MSDTITVQPVQPVIVVTSQSSAVTATTRTYSLTVTNQPVMPLTVTLPPANTLTISAPGPQGPPGPSGPAGGASSFVQSSPASTWVVTHNLGRTPILEVYVGGVQVVPDVIVTSLNVATVVFATPQTGEVVYT